MRRPPTNPSRGGWKVLLYERPLSMDLLWFGKEDCLPPKNRSFMQYYFTSEFLGLGKTVPVHTGIDQITGKDIRVSWLEKNPQADQSITRNCDMGKVIIR